MVISKNIKIIGIVALGLLVIVLVWYFFIHKKVAPVVLKTRNPEVGYIAQSVTATGKIEPVDTVTVGSQVSGIIKNLYVNFNSKVKKGELLAQLDKSLLQASLDLVKGNLQNAQSQQVYAQNNFNRQNLLFKADAISKADFDIAQNILIAAKGSVLSAQASVRQATKTLSYTDIYSPIDGVVLNRSISAGQTVAASFNTPTLFVIAKDITKMEVEAAVDEADIGNVKAGDRASFTVDAFLDNQFAGNVSEVRLHPTVSANVVTYITIINTSNNDMKLKPGMTANIIIYTKEIQDALLIPSKALNFVPDSSMMKDYKIIDLPIANSSSTLKRDTRQSPRTKTSKIDTSATRINTAYVWVLKGKSINKTEVKTGLNDNLHVQIISGLTTSDLVITGVINTANAASTTANGSPFLPTRGSQGKKAK